MPFRPAVGFLAAYLALLAVLCDRAWGAPFYTSDFEGAIGPEWSTAFAATTPLGGRSFLGQFGAETVTLTLNELPSHSAMTISFDLFLIQSWDGNGDVCCGPDTWSVTLDGTAILLSSFAVVPFYNQSYPASYPNDIVTHPANTGAAEINTLGYSYVGDAVYRLTFTLPHTRSSVVFAFTSGQSQPIDDESWGLDNVAVSLLPSSTGLPGKIVFSGGGSDIWTVRPDGTHLTRLTNNDDAYDSFPAWSRDGRKIAFGRVADGSQGNIYVMNADGSDVRPITHDTLHDYGPTWSPDGRYIAFTKESSSSNGDIYIVSADGSGEPTRLTHSGFNRDPAWSPDGRHIAYVHSGHILNVIAADGSSSEPLVLVDDPTSGAFDPSWSPTDSLLAFCTTAPSQISIRTIVPTTPSDVTNVTTPPVEALHPSWSPDGSYIVFTRNDQFMSDILGTLYIVNKSGFLLGAIPGLASLGAVDADWAVCTECSGVDSDGDGVGDVQDGCPDTTPETPVDASGCACTQKVCDDSDQCNGVEACNLLTAACGPGTSPPDSDGDGVSDVCDSCPRSSEVFAVPGDDDGDGIADVCDACPDTPAMETVDSFGCACEEKLCDDDVQCNGIEFCEPVTAECVRGPYPAVCDRDSDGRVGTADNCGRIYNPQQKDRDHDGVGDACDNCPALKNSNQVDIDNDAIGDACEPSLLPAVSELAPGEASLGATITILGTNFGSFAAGGYILVGDNPVHSIAWKKDKVKILLPDLAYGTYNVRVVTPAGMSTQVLPIHIVPSEEKKAALRNRIAKFVKFCGSGLQTVSFPQDNTSLAAILVFGDFGSYEAMYAATLNQYNLAALTGLLALEAVNRNRIDLAEEYLRRGYRELATADRLHSAAVDSLDGALHGATELFEVIKFTADIGVGCLGAVHPGLAQAYTGVALLTELVAEFHSDGLNETATSALIGGGILLIGDSLTDQANFLLSDSSLRTVINAAMKRPDLDTLFAGAVARCGVTVSSEVSKRFIRDLRDTGKTLKLFEPVRR